MNYKEIKDFADKFSFNEFYSLTEKGNYERVKQTSLACNNKLVAQMWHEDSFNLDKDAVEWLLNTVPSQYIIDNKLVIYRNDKFWTFDFKMLKATCSKDEPAVDYIYDMNKDFIGRFAAGITTAVELLKREVKEYEENCKYEHSNYSKVERVEIPNSTYDYAYSLTNEESKKMAEWQAKHFKKFHKPVYQGAISVSNTEVRFRATSIGVYCDCVCTECEKEYEKTGNEKIKKNMFYEVRKLE